MRASSQLLVPRCLWRSAIWLCAVLPLLASAPALGTQYDAGTPITEVSITNPTPNEVWLAGSDHTLTCTTATDTDLACDGGDWYPVSDSVTHYWTGSGTFKDNDNIGTSVEYICTTTAGTNTVTVFADDNYAPDNNTAIVDESASSDSETLTVVVPRLEWVQFGGGNKHALYKKDTNPWNPANEIYGTDYATAVPDRAWVRSPALADPVCYTKNTTGGQATASINFTTPQALTESSTVTISGFDSNPYVFFRDGVGVSGTSTTVPATAYGTPHLTNSIGSQSWSILWAYWVRTGAYAFISVGSSQNPLYRTWDVPTGSGNTATAKRMQWACGAANNQTGITGAAEKVADAANGGARFANQQPLNVPIWKALDPTGYSVDCGEGSNLAVHGLWLLGIGSAAQDFAYPTGGIPAGDKDASSQETTTCSNPAHGTIYLRYDQSLNGYLNNYEGCFTVDDSGTTKYLTVFDRYATVADPLGLLRLLNVITPGITQWWSYGTTVRVKDSHDHPNSVTLPTP